MNKRTEDNLKTAFAGESQARNKYTFFASVARKEGLLGVAAFFDQAANNEKEHAEKILKLLMGIGDTAANLQTAVDGESYEYKDMYPEFARAAHEEGEEEAARYFEAAASVEKDHARRFQDLLDRLKGEGFLKSETKIAWRCRQCGYVHEGTEPPEVCPLCGHTKEYYAPACDC